MTTSDLPPTTGHDFSLVRLARKFFALAGACLIAGPVAAQSTTVVISQVYGGGGNAGALYKNDFIELHNISGNPVSIDGWSVQYSSATGSTWGSNKTDLTGIIAAGGYFLIAQAAGAGGAEDLPTPDATGSANMSGTVGKVALVNSSTALTGTDPHADASVVDFVGYGTNASGFEGSAPAPAPSNTASVIRKSDGSLDTNDNSTDFEVSNPPFPRNSSYSAGPDETPPSIASLSPADDAIDVVAADTLEIAFSEPVVAGTGSIVVMSGAATFATMPAGQVAISGANATITLPSSLSASTSYHVLIDAGAFVDSSGNDFVGISDATTWNFTTAAPDVTPPAIVSFTPADDASDVLPAANLVIELDETVVAGSGALTIFKTVGNELVETIDVENSRIRIVGNTVSVDPEFLLEPSTSYYVTFLHGFVEDPAGNEVAALAGAVAWNFTTRGIPPLLINQYYEGAGLDRYIELKNTTPADLILDGYRLAAWSDGTGGGGREGWKGGESSTERIFYMDGLIIPAESTYLIANIEAVNPAYAALSANAKGTDSDTATFFSGTASVVLYQGGFFEAPEFVIDAVSITGSEGTDTSFYRKTEVPAFNFQPGSSIIDDLGQAWLQTDLVAVANASPEDPEYLLALTEESAPILESFTVGGGVPVVVTPLAKLGYTTSAGTPTEYMVSESPTFDGAEWIPLPGAAPLYELGGPSGTKTVYFKVRNQFGESAALSQETAKQDFVNPETVLITQYYEGASNNKYLELTNVSDAPVDLGGWIIVRWTNADRENWKITGQAPGSSSGTINLFGTIAAGETLLISHNSAAVPVSPGAVYLETSALSHNGDDSLTLYEGAVNPANLRGVAAFAGNDGADRSFVRISGGQGFDFEPGSGMIDFPAVWQEFSLAEVNAAMPGQNQHLGSYGDSGPPGGTYAAWIAGFDVGTEIHEADDFDNDGIPNALESYFGTDPSVANPGIRQVSAAPGTLGFQHPISAMPAIDIFVSYEWSLDLDTWVDAGVAIAGTTVDISVFESGGTATVEAEASGSPAAEIFVRLKVE